LTLRTASRVVTSGKRKYVTLGAATFRAKVGSTVTVRVKLSAKGRQLVRRLKRLKVKAAAVNQTGTATKTLMLKSVR
jgi:hypothetical protein